MRALPLVRPNFVGLAEAELVGRARAGDGQAFREIMRRNNRRLYRVARSVLRNDAEAEDAVQEAYTRAFGHFQEFQATAALSTWLTRIVLNEALGRLRRRRATCDVAELDSLPENGGNVVAFPLIAETENPEAAAARAQIRRLLERAVDELPEPFRVVFVMRALEDISVEETASQLGVKPETVKTRLHRARRLLRKALDQKLASALTDTFPFDGERCARIADRVMNRLGLEGGGLEPTAPTP